MISKFCLCSRQFGSTGAYFPLPSEKKKTIPHVGSRDDDGAIILFGINASHDR